jgi:hypothetical protein
MTLFLCPRFNTLTHYDALVSSFSALNDASNPGPLGAADMRPTSTVRCVGKYPIRTDMNLAPSKEQNVSIELFFRTTRHHIGSVSDKSGNVEPSE